MICCCVSWLCNMAEQVEVYNTLMLPKSTYFTSRLVTNPINFKPNMLFSTVLLTIVPAVVYSAPTVERDNWKPSYQKDSFPFQFTSTLIAYAGPDQVVNNSQVAVPGLPGGYGTFSYGLNSHEDVICYVSPVHPTTHRVSNTSIARADPQNISVYIKGNYSSPAVTATHIHEAVRGRAGPPRIAFPNPQPPAGKSLSEYSWRTSVGCLKGPLPDWRRDQRK